MELQDIQAGLANFEELKKKVEATRPADDGKETRVKQWNPTAHDVADAGQRPDKTVKLDDGSTRIVKVARLPVPMQKRIVSRAAQFLCGNPIQLVATPADQLQSDLLTVLQVTWDANKLDYASKGLAKRMMAETEVAELWYPEALDATATDWVGTPNEGKAKFRLRVKILAPSLGDTLTPVYNSVGDMIAFGRGYTVEAEGKKVERFDLYTADAIYQGAKGEGGWAATTITNTFKKIPVIYYRQDAAEWADVQAMIDRLERLISNHSDTNDYHASPTIKVKGQISGFSQKGEQGKLIELEGEGADASYMEWNHATDSIKLEYQNLRSLILDMTDTPDISFEQMKGLGTFSGIALKMLFLGAHMKAADKEEIFGEGIQRRINFLKAALATINLGLVKAVALSIKPKFEYFLPKNDLERVEMLSTAAGGKAIISQETAVAHNPLVSDPVEEIKRLQKEGANTEFNA